MTKTIELVVLCLLSHVLDAGNCFEATEEGSHCQKRGLPGICKLVYDCPIALESLRRRRRHDLLRCGFVGTDEVVCCPDLSDRHPTIETSTIDKSTVWSGENNIQTNEDDGNKDLSSNRGDTKGERKCERMCTAMYKKLNVSAGINFNILNGEDAEEGQFPHMAALGIENDDYEIDYGRCAASLISPRFLISAAHCFACQGCSRDRVKNARFGVIHKSDGRNAQDVDIKEVHLSSYDITSNHNDIALIELVRDVIISKSIYPACLYTKADDPLGLIVSGWGTTDAADLSSRSNQLKYAKLVPVPIDKCNTTLLSRNVNTMKVILNTQICAISNQSDACTGDSGGPLQLERKYGGYDIVGIVSYGIQCGTTVPGVYTRVSAYLDWIEEKVWQS